MRAALAEVLDAAIGPGAAMGKVVSVDSKLRRDRARRLRREVTAQFDRVCWTVLSACRETDPRQRGRWVDRRR